MRKVVVDPAALEEAAKWLEVHSSSSGSAEAFAAEALREAIAQPAEAEGVELRRYTPISQGDHIPTMNSCDQGRWVHHSDHLAALSAVTAERDALKAENKRLDLAVAQADHNYDMDRNRMMYLLRTAHDCLEQWNLKYPRLAKRGEEFSSEHTYRQIRAFVPEYREADAIDDALQQS